MLSRFFVFLLLLAFLFNSMGNFFIYEIRKKLLHEEIRTQLPSGSRRICVLSQINTNGDKNFRWFAKDEFIYMGNLYDVIRELKVGAFTTFYCIQDINEEILLQAYQKVNKDKDLVILQDHLIKNALLKRPVDQLPGSVNPFHFSPYQWNVVTWERNPQNPPPEFRS